MKRAIRVITIASFLMLFPGFNISGLRAENDENKESEDTKTRTGRIIALNEKTGIILDNLTGAIYEFSKDPDFEFFLEAKVAYTFDAAQSGRVIIRAITR